MARPERVCRPAWRPPGAGLLAADPLLVVSGSISILKHQEDTFAAELHRLKQQPLFSLVDFEDLIDRIRSTVAEVSALLSAERPAGRRLH